MSIITLVQAGLILGKRFGFLQAWSWVEVFAPSVIYLGIGFLVGLIEAYDELSKKKVLASGSFQRQGNPCGSFEPRKLSRFTKFLVLNISFEPRTEVA